MRQQELILGAIKDRLRVDYTIDAQWANTGTIRAIDPKTLAATRTLNYDFHNGRAAFTRPGETLPLACVYYDRPRPTGALDCVKSTPMEMVTAVIDYLEGR